MTRYLLYERKIVIGHEAVRLQLLRNQQDFLLERRLVQQDRVTLEQVLLIQSVADLESFSIADPYARQPTKFYGDIREKISPAIGQPAAVNDGTLQKIFSVIVAAPDESALSLNVQKLIGELGAESYVFVSLHPDDYSVERASHRFLIGCRPGWCGRHRYVGLEAHRHFFPRCRESLGP